MHKWVPYALIRVTLFYVLGIILAIYQGSFIDKELAALIVISLALVYFLFWVFLRKLFFDKYNLLLSITGFSLIFFLGFLNLKYFDQSQQESHILHKENVDAYIGIVQERHYETEKTNRYLISIHSIRNKDWEESIGKIYLYVSKGFEKIFQPGDQLMVYGSPDELQEPMNPGEFNYRRFLSFKNIYHHDYSTGENIDITGYTEPNWFLATSASIREWAVQQLELAIPEKREQTIALALILGVKDGLTDEIKNAYSASGAMHVLAVSGLHVGIIYGIILLIFGKLQENGKTKWILAIVSLFSLWLYAAVTGFSPSVLRAVTMFSFIALAKASGRTTNIYNTLAASGLILLIFDPYLIMSVGFQLSYLAVLGIVYIYPKIYSVFIVENKIIDKIWSITSVSLAAQLSTFALGMLYFHQFPTFFLVSNLVVIFGAFLILSGGLIVLLVSFSEVLFSFFSLLLSNLIYGINYFVFLIEDLPNSLIENIYINTFQTWLIMIGILSLFLMFQYRKLAYLYIPFFCLLIFVSIRINWLHNNINKKEITFHRVNNHVAIDFIADGKSLLLTDSLLWMDEDKKRFHIAPNQLQSYVNEKSSIFLSSNQKPFHVVSWNNFDFLILKGDIKDWEISSLFTYDFVILANDFRGSIEDVVDQVNFDHLILDGSLKGYVADRLLKEVNALNIDAHSVYHDGAKQITL